MLWRKAKALLGGVPDATILTSYQLVEAFGRLAQPDAHLPLPA
jgi:hypothetical protein